MSGESTNPSPVVLIVEDEARALELRIDAFSDAGFTAIGVQTADEAVRELRAGPAVDVVLTDIRLDKSVPDDKSGVDLARYIKDSYGGGMPVAGYSAVFRDSDVEGDRGIFDAFWTKGTGGIGQIDKIIARCREYALDRRRARQQEALEAYDELRRGHEEAYPDVELMRELRPGADSTAPRNDASLANAGYRLKLVEADKGLAQPVIVWLLDTGEGTDAEVYGQPALYAHGHDDTEAITLLVDLMRLYAEDIGPDAMAAVGPALSLTEFLRERLGDPSNE